MKKIRWGIIGCGDVTEVKSGPGFQKANGSELAAVMRRTAHLAEDYAKRHKVPKWYSDANELIHDPDIDAVYVATPPSSHKEYAIAAANAGKPVYVEKPMALNFDECRDMIQTCEDARVPLFVAYYRRALPRFLKIKSLLEENAIGDLRFVNVTFYNPPYRKDLERIENWRVDRAIGGEGYFYDLASHNIDILQFLFGDIIYAAGQFSNQRNLYDASDMVSGHFRFESGIHGVGLWNFNSFKKFDRNEIIGERGKITFSTFGSDPVILETKKIKKKYEIQNPRHIQQPFIQTMVNELLGKGKCQSTGYSGSKTNWVMDQILGIK